MGPGVNVIKLFIFVTDAPNKQARTHVPCTQCQEPILNWSTFRLQPYLKILDQAGKACLGQTL
jgi:hypothetical protein